jgi:ubiquinone/menaquinone biosynthesis C-methylase UbiE
MPVSAYDEIAEWYDGWVGDRPMRTDPFFPAAEALMDNVREQRILDLACGQGRVARYLADQGAQVVGIDISTNLLEIARRRETDRPPGAHRAGTVEYRQADAQTLDGFADGSLDGVICHMALMDIADLQATLRAVVRVLRPGGWFVFSTLHPCYNPAPSGEMMTPQGIVRTVSGYFTEGYWRSDARTGPPGKVGAYHRTLSTYANGLIGAGLTIEQIAEPRLTGDHAAARPVWSEVPAALVVRCTKAAMGASRGRRKLHAAGAGRSGQADVSERVEEILRQALA